MVVYKKSMGDETRLPLIAWFIIIEFAQVIRLFNKMIDRKETLKRLKSFLRESEIDKQ